MFKRLGMSDAIFGRHLVDNGVYPNDGYLTKPQNWDEILGIMEQPRPVFIPSESYDAKYLAFCSGVTEVLTGVQNKRDVMRQFSPSLQATLSFTPLGIITFTIWTT